MEEKKRYQKKDPISHILDRPDMYVGSVWPREIDEYIYIGPYTGPYTGTDRKINIIDSSSAEENGKIILKNISISPALLRIFVEPLSNAIDNVERSKEKKMLCTTIKIDMNMKTGYITVYNNGDYIPIEKNEEGTYYHTMLFGELLTSSNYDDDEERLISGRNGLGINLTCIFSSNFKVEAYDPKKKKLFLQEWSGNMRITKGPIVTSSKGGKIVTPSKGFTRVTYKADFSRFGIKKYTQDIFNLFSRYVIEAAMLTKIKVHLNGKIIHLKNGMLDYSVFYEDPEEKIDKLKYEYEGSEIVVTSSDSFEIISFVNGVFTSKGGTHVKAWTEAVLRPIVKFYSDKSKNASINIKDVRQFFKFFINVKVPNPEFEGQEKHTLMSPKTIPTDFPQTKVNILKRWESTKRIEDIIKRKEFSALDKTTSKRKTKISGLDHANKSGTKFSSECNLILCEGNSAKTYAVTGIEVGVNGKKGRDFWGVMPLRGKLLNVRGKNPALIAKNQVITNIIQAFGLKYNLDYSQDNNYKTLKYGRLMILADSDSVTGDTPLLLKNEHNLIEIATIENIFGNIYTKTEFGKEVNYINYEVWTETGWTKIKKVIRHKVSKEIYRISTASGCVDVTEDHSLITENNETISPKECKIRDILLHSFPIFTNENLYDFINEDEAYALGIFWVNEHIQLVNVENKRIFERRNTNIYKNVWDIRNFPMFICDSDIKIKKSFYRGCSAYNLYCEKCNLKCKCGLKIKIKGKLGAQGTYYFCKSLGHKVTVENIDSDFYIISSWKTHDNNNEFHINKIQRVGKLQNEYVYDLETENHHFQAGVGSLIVHNTDGIHICSLILNVFHYLFPTLLERDPSFLTSMQTPIVRVFLKSSQLIFYDESAFKKYAEKQNKKLKVKYYKGLGTSNNKEVKETFGKKIIEFIEDKNTGSVMNKCFGNDTGVRKDWLTNYDPTKTGTSVGNDPGTIELGISKYLNTELIKFSLDDCSRSIPNLFDGLKQSQRKILYTCFSRKLNYTGKVLKVAQLSGSVAELTSYHHGEQNLYTTITKMAQVFTGSNNIPLLFRDGQFGSLMSMGKDAASARYIFTKLEMLTRYLYKQEDDVLLKHLEDDGEKIEPECYVPIIPMILINGSSGIGTGWSCNVPCFNPLDIINCIKIWLENDGKDVVDFSDPMFKISIFPELKPWYRGFSGNIEKDDDRKFTSYGIMTEEMGNKKIITQLPIGMSIDKFKEYLEELEDKKSIKKFNNYSKPNKPYFEIFENTGGMEYSLHSLKLETTIRTSNMVLFLTDGKLKKFESIDEIIDQFCQVRYRLYTDRKNYMLNELQNNLKWTSNKRRFLEEVMEDKLILRRREEEDITKEMENKGYDKKIKKQKLEIERINEEMEESEIKEKGYDYLLTLHIRSFTKAMLAKLDKEIAELKIKIKELTLISEKDLWLKDLEEFENVYVKWLKIIEIEEESAKIKKKNNKKK